MINLDHVHFQHKTVIYFVQTFGNIYTIVPFCKHTLRVFHAIAWLILLAHDQTNFPPVRQLEYSTTLCFYSILIRFYLFIVLRSHDFFSGFQLRAYLHAVCWIFTLQTIDNILNNSVKDSFISFW